MNDRRSDNKFHIRVLGEAFQIWRDYCDQHEIAACTFEEFLESWHYHEPNMVSGPNGDQTISIFWRPDGPVVQVSDTLQVRIWRPSDKPEQEQSDKLDLFDMMRRLMTEAQKTNVQLALISERLDTMALDFTKVDAALGALQATAQQNSTDIAAILAKLAGITPADPADQVKLDAVGAALTAIKANQDTSDASIEAVLNPPAPAAAPATATPAA